MIATLFFIFVVTRPMTETNDHGGIFSCLFGAMGNWGREHTGLAIRYFLRLNDGVYYCLSLYLSSIPFLQRLS